MTKLCCRPGCPAVGLMALPNSEALCERHLNELVYHPENRASLEATDIAVEGLRYFRKLGGKLS